MEAQPKVPFVRPGEIESMPATRSSRVKTGTKKNKPTFVQSIASWMGPRGGFTYSPIDKMSVFVLLSLFFFLVQSAGEKLC